MALEEIKVKFSSKHLTTPSTPFGWCFSVSTDFLASHPNLPPRCVLDRVEDTIYIQFGTQGNMFGTLPGKLQWVQISRKWLNNFHNPAGFQSAVEMDAIYDSDTHRVKLNPHQYTELMVKAMSDEPEQPILDDTILDRFTLSPRTNGNTPKPSKNKKTIPFLRRAPMPNEDVVDPLQQHPRVLAAHERQESRALATAILPPSIAVWTDQNIRNLRQLIMDLQIKRPEIVFSVVNGIVTMKKQTFEDI